jgi:hypothetical protein
MVNPRAHHKPSKAEIAKRAALQRAALAWPT